jgi:hypothetical protein
MMKYYQVEGWNEDAVVAVHYVSADTEQDAIRQFKEAEGDYRYIEANEITLEEYRELTRE